MLSLTNFKKNSAKLKTLGRIHILFWSFVLGFSIFTCQKEIEIDIQQQEPKLVINSLFTPDSIFKINICKSSYIFDSNYIYIDDAIATLYENDILIDTFVHQYSGYYIIPEFKPKAEKKYKLIVEKEGFKTVYAEDSIPLKRTFQFIEKKLNVGLDQDEIFFYSTLKVEFQNYKKFYLLNIYTNICDENHPCLLTFNSNSTIYTEEINGFTSRFPYTDKYIEVPFYNINFMIYNNNSFDTFLETTIFYLHFTTISENYYKFLKSYYKYGEFQNEIPIFRGEPSIFYTNIGNGYGIFAGYNCYVDSI